jgi:hypothetical protein
VVAELLVEVCPLLDGVLLKAIRLVSSQVRKVDQEILNHA